MPYPLEMHESFDCERAIEDVFDYVVDFSRVEQWDHTITSSRKISDGSVGLRSKFNLVFAMGPRKIPIAYEITEFDYPRCAVLTGVSDNFTAVDTVTLSKTNSGCHLDWHAKLVFTGLAVKTVPLLKSKIVAGGAQTIRDLETALKDQFPIPQLGNFSKLADKLVVPGILSFSKMGYCAHRKEWKPVTASVKGRHALVTGATSGLGRVTAERLAHLGASVSIVARDKVKAEKTAEEIIQVTGNSNVEVEIADLSEMAEVVALGQRLPKKKQAIDILVNNAGALFNERQETGEGLERTFALLLLGPYILTEQLCPLLVKSRAARIINVSSGGMYAKRLSISNLENKDGEYRGTEAYARAKRGLVILGEQWAEKWSGHDITVHNMHPGWAKTPGVEASMPGFTMVTNRILRTPEEGADTIIWLATATEVAQTSGLFWLDRLPHTTHLVEKTRETQEQRSELRSALSIYADGFRKK